jgi:hypothetical protein
MKYLLLLLITSIFVSSARNSEIPSGLMTEFIREPAGVRIMDLKPEFTWIVPARSEKQIAYRILVAGSPEKINRNQGDVWDSGITQSSQSVEIECGILLKENTSYFWKVMIIDAKGRKSEYSRFQGFKTGNPVKYSTTSNKFEFRLITPVSLKNISGFVLADFGKDAFGTLIFDVPSSAKDTITVRLGEKLAGTRIDRNPGGTIRSSEIRLAPAPGKHTVKLIKDTRNTGPAAVQLPDSFGIITPFRYCEVENFPVKSDPSQLKQVIFHYFFRNDNSSFSSDDTIINRIWDICKYSIKATSFAGLYVDGDRERIPYEADAYINQLGHYYTDREYSIARRTNEYFIDHPTWPTEWILQTVPLFYNDYMFTGNAESLKNYYDLLKHKTLTSLAGEDGLISSRNVTAAIMKDLGFVNEKERIRDIVDWPPAQKDTGWKLATAAGERDGYDMVDVNTVVNAFYCNGLARMAEIADALDNKKDADYYRNEAESVRRVFNEKLLDRSKGIYIDGIGSGHSSLHANMMALAFGLVPDEYKKSVIAFIKSRKMACSVYGAQYLLEGLFKAGEEDYAFELLTSTDDRSWWNMIKSGSTITLEAWDMKYKPNSDWNHAWGAAPANIIPAYMWGITPSGPGWSKTTIRPRLSKLTESTIMVPTIRGNILAEYTKKGDSSCYRITLPGNMEGEFVAGRTTIQLKAGLNKIKI